MKLQVVFLCVLAVIYTRVDQVCGAKILALLTLASPSHHFWNKVLLHALVKRGHEVTVVSQDVEKNPMANLTYIHLEGTYEHIKANTKYADWTSEAVTDKMRALRDSVFMICRHHMQTEGVKKILGYPDGRIFDLILVESEYSQCFWPLISKFGNPPVVALCGSGLPRSVNYMTGSPKNPAYTPDYITPYTDRMSFMQRMHSSAAEIINYWIHYFEYLPTLRQIAQDRFDFPVPPLDEYERNISLVLGNVVFGFQAPRPIAPNVIPVGGMNLQPAKPLGSNVQSATLPADVQQAFLDVFASLPQRVLWKFETDALKNVPKNVMLSKWLPQTDILGHKNMKLFITHNGLFSSQEAAYFGVPTIGIPFFMDQQGNAALAEKHGVGISLSSHNLNKEIIQKSIAQILTDSSYAENARRLSRIFRDQPEHPLDQAVFWVEYVLRHGGAPHLRTAAVGMPLYQYLLLDILGALLVALVVTLLLLRAGARWLWRRFGAAGRKEKTN